MRAAHYHGPLDHRLGIAALDNPRCSTCPAAGRCVVEWTRHDRYCTWPTKGGAWKSRVIELSAEGPAEGEGQHVPFEGPEDGERAGRGADLRGMLAMEPDTIREPEIEAGAPPAPPDEVDALVVARAKSLDDRRWLETIAKLIEAYTHEPDREGPVQESLDSLLGAACARATRILRSDR